MKTLSIILCGISSLFAGNQIGEEIDFYPRLLQKELISLSCGQNFRMQELSIPYSDEIAGQVNGKFFTVFCAAGEKLHAYVGRVNSCRAGGCRVGGINDPAGDYEFFDYFILFDSRKAIRAVRVFNYEATHGQEIMVKSWLNQFTGYDGSKSLRVGKEIDSVSGATISVDGLVADVNSKSHLIRTLLPD